MLDLTIVVVNWNTCDLTKQNLRSIFQTLSDLEYEVIVVDNASSDGSVEMVRTEFPRVSLLQNHENVGFSRANNQAINQSQGRYVLLLNSDAYLTDQAGQILVRKMDEMPDVGIAGAGLYNPDGTVQEDHGNLPTLSIEIITLLGLNKVFNRFRQNHGVREKTGWVKGAAMVLRKEMLDQIGLLDEDFFMFSEEIDLCYRAKQAGWNVLYLPEAHVVHLEAGSTGQIVERVLRLYNGKLRYYRLHHGVTSRLILLSAMFVSSYLKFIVYSLIGLFRPLIRKNASFWASVVTGLREQVV
jgi:N-acetylglucosaminyl-diphospho-decaprenol L-rhamnosyltransferase